MLNKEVIASSPALIDPPGFWRLFRLWLLVGVQSFGGGSSTIFLIRREFMTKRAWLTDEEYTRFWVLCQLTPGVNIISLTILIGRKLGGASGIAASLAGLLLPSAAITTGLAAGFSSIQNWPPIQAMIKGIIPATAGFSLLVAIQFARPLLALARKEGRLSLSLSLLIIACCALLVGLVKISVAFVLIGAATIGAIGFARIWAKPGLSAEVSSLNVEQKKGNS